LNLLTSPYLNSCIFYFEVSSNYYPSSTK